MNITLKAALNTLSFQYSMIERNVKLLDNLTGGYGEVYDSPLLVHHLETLDELVEAYDNLLCEGKGYLQWFMFDNEEGSNGLELNKVVVRNVKDFLKATENGFPPIEQEVADDDQV